MTRSARALFALLVLTIVLTACTWYPGSQPRSDSGSPASGSSAPQDSASPETTGAPRTGAPTASSGSEPSGSEPSGNGQPGTFAQLVALFGGGVSPKSSGTFGLDRWTLIPTGTGVPGDSAVRVEYPKGSASPAASRNYGSPGGGMQVYLTVDGQRPTDAYLRYWVRFPADFDFVRGGKLPGLFGGTKVSGGDKPDGTDGFSTRLMWRTKGAGEVYLYAPHKSGKSLGRGSWTWPRGTWTCVEQHVQLNTPGEKDGSVTVWLNGKQVLTEQDILYRTVDSLRIDGIFFSTFYGGDNPGWAPPQDEHADFAGFALSPRPIGCGPG
jgi:hypothetical protein